MNNETQKLFKYGMFLILVLGFFLIALSLKVFKEFNYVGKDIPPLTTITFSGKGEEVAVPDVATFTFTMSEESLVVKDAQEKVTGRVNTALAHLKDFGIEDKNIKTTAYNIYPKYEYVSQNCTVYGCPPARRELSGYEVSQTIEVKIENIDDAGEILGAMGEIGVNQISGLTFSVSNEEDLVREARKEAIAKAKEKAEALATDLKVRLVRIVNFYESGHPSPYLYGTATSFERKAEGLIASPAIPAGENKIISEVNITYEIR
ncbi:MAG: SIMPL domain-containing protein [Candidatus Pacebacteria bacterium]|nr:SIMPL domain-containing protein [Candidatus Paceibacterota bacterium]